MFLSGFSGASTSTKVPWGALTNSQLVQQRYHIDAGAIIYTNNQDVTIYKAKFMKSLTTKETVDIYAKAIQRSKAGQRADYVVKQLEMLKAIKHPFFVKVLDTFLFPKWAFIFMEPLKGNLADELAKKVTLSDLGLDKSIDSDAEKKSPKKSPSKTIQQSVPHKLNEEQAKVWFGEIADALFYMHHTGWAHRDITPAAILIENNKRAALCSFGYVLQNPSGQLTESHVQTDVTYMSPERLVGAPYNPFASDIYSFGMLIFIATTGNRLYQSNEFDHMKSVQAKLNKIIDKSKISADLKDLIKKMCDVKQSKRPLMKKVTKHPWFTKAGPGVKSVSPLAQWPNRERGHQVKRTLGNDWKNNETFPAQIESAGYRIEELIGKGGFGSVYRGWKGHRPVAVKIIDVINQSEDYKKKFKDRELEVLRRYDHPNICKVYDIYIERNRFTEKETKERKEMNRRIFIFMDLCKGDMEQLEKIQKPEKRFQEVHARPLLLGAAKGIEYLHAKRVCHRDLKLANILYKSKTHALITDFTFAKETPHTVLALTFIGTLAYQCPEILIGDEKKGYNPYAADTWAYGCCLYLAITGQLPFTGGTKEQLIRKQKEDGIEVIQKAKISDQARDLLFKTMKYDEKDRIPFANIIRHEWFRCNMFTYDTWPEKSGQPPPDPAASIPPLQGI